MDSPIEIRYTGALDDFLSIFKATEFAHKCVYSSVGIDRDKRSRLFNAVITLSPDGNFSVSVSPYTEDNPAGERGGTE